MGMDVYGNSPSTEVGEYFRANVWRWHPLASYATAHYPALTAACEHWHTNDGDGLDAEGARALGEALLADVESGRALAYADQHAAALAALPNEPCNLCNGTGLRTDEIGVTYGYDKPRDPATGRGGCNGCAGVGEREHWARSYSFDVEALGNFARFLCDSGGFAIC